MSALWITSFVLTITLHQVFSMKACHCWEGYKAVRTHNEHICYSKELMHRMSCNIPQPPSCNCTGNNGILKDTSGTWCTIYIDGHELERWPCENTEDWTKFFKKHHLEHQHQPQ